MNIYQDLPKSKFVSLCINILSISSIGPKIWFLQHVSPLVFLYSILWVFRDAYNAISSEKVGNSLQILFWRRPSPYGPSTSTSCERLDVARYQYASLCYQSLYTFGKIDAVYALGEKSISFGYRHLSRFSK